jgi:hypothetical protein
MRRPIKSPRCVIRKLNIGLAGLGERGWAR